MSRYLFEMSDADIDRAVQTYYDRMYRDAYEQPEPHCKDCTHYCGGECERFNDDEDSEDYGEYYVPVNPDDDVCDNFEADEYDNEPPEPEYFGNEYSDPEWQ